MELAPTPELRHDGPVTPMTPPTGVLPRAALVMRLLHEAGPAGLRLSQLVQRTGLPQPTAHRLLADLAEEGAVTRRGAAYALGDRWGPVGFEPVTPRCLIEREASRAVVQAAADELGDTVYLAARAAGGVAYLLRCDGDSPVRVFTVEVGEVKRLAAGYAGIALLAALPPERRRAEVDAVVARPPRRWNLTDDGALHDLLDTLLRQMDEQGWCGGVPVVPGVAGVACGVPARMGSIPQVSLTASAAEQRMPPARVPEVAEVLRAAATRLAEIGG